MCILMVELDFRSSLCCASNEEYLNIQILQVELCCLFRKSKMGVKRWIPRGIIASVPMCVHSVIFSRNLVS